MSKRPVPAPFPRCDICTDLEDESQFNRAAVVRNGVLLCTRHAS